ncbi:acid phosphatase type 7 [Neocloeon triangulifer]|uniref:acid phosphatase type 7 n=1 Tax=Neocloeon triangulifer TaxID=2078957 RepID=UPI00286F6097|nr:acid phosphatase type 7 [Neocloeon triangulifer]
MGSHTSNYGIILILAFCNLTQGLVFFQPEQIHISYGDSPSEMIVTWSTVDPTEHSIVEYGIGGLILNTHGRAEVFIDGGKKSRTQFIHTVKLKDLTPGTTYMYHCGSSKGWSEIFTFTTMKEGTNWSPRFAVFGDMGNVNAQSLPRIQQETQRGHFDAILHVGDFAYDMNTDNAKVGDEFMRQIQSIAAYVPYMTCPGNHEEAYNFSNYRARFSMPSSLDSMVYSFDIGPAHIIGISTEFYYFLEYGFKQVVKQYEWLEQDLIKANKNRKERPWIITFGHRPMYCTNLNRDDCTKHETLVRSGLPFLHWFSLEDLFYEHGVDLEIWAHEHSYERLFPIYDYKVYNGSYEAPYTNYKAPVHIITGSAGCQEGREHFTGDKPDWSAFRSNDYGYARMTVQNKTHLYFEQVSDDKKGAVLDSLWLIKDLHGPYKN